MKTPWEDVSLPDRLVTRRMRLNMDDGKPKVEFHSTQDVEPILENNQALFNRDNFSGSLWAGRSWVKVAEIPDVLIEKWKREDGIDFLRGNKEDMAKLIKRLNSNEYLKLRTAPGKI